MNNSKERDNKAEAFLSGEYFAPTSSLIKCIVKTTAPQRWSEMHRNSTDENPVAICVRRKATSATLLDPYSLTRNAIQAKNDGVASSLTTRTESDKATSATTAIWCRDIFGRQNFDAKLARIAHIIPAGKVEHEEWFGIAGALIGLDEHSATESKLMALRGTKKRELNASSQEAGSGENKTCRVRHSGYLHAVSNKMRLQGQAGILYGEKPRMLIIPVMTLDAAKDWRGEGYEAAVLVGLPESHIPLGYTLDEGDEATVYTDMALTTKKVYRDLKSGTGVLLTYPEATESQKMLTACASLSQSVLGMAQYVRSLVSCDLSLLQTKNQTLLKQRSQSKSADVIVPQYESGRDKPVLFVRFGSQRGDEDVNTHPAPDPLALLCKAANGWSYMVGQKLLVNSEPPDLDDYDYELKELDDHAEQEYFWNLSQPLEDQRAQHCMK